MLRVCTFRARQFAIGSTRLLVGTSIKSISTLSTTKLLHSVQLLSLWPKSLMFGPEKSFEIHHRNFATMTSDELQKRIDNVNYLFTEARELIADALDSAGTKYFEEDLKVIFLTGFQFFLCF